MGEIINLHSNRIELWSGTIKGESQPTWFIDLWENGGCCSLGDSKDYKVALADAKAAAGSFGYPLVRGEDA